MSIQPRQVKNKKDENHVPTHKPGTVYDVFISYKDTNGNRHTYGKRGFVTKSLAMQHEAEMFVTLNRSGSHKYYNATLGFAGLAGRICLQLPGPIYISGVSELLPAAHHAVYRIGRAARGDSL